MRRGVHGVGALETINAAATMIASAETRGPHDSSFQQKRRWGSCWSLYWCFGSNKNSKRIGHAVLIPESTPYSAVPDPPTSHPPPQHPSSNVLPFMAPPSSPASFLPSEPPSAAQSPTGLPPSMTSMPSNTMYSPTKSTTIFSIGPYAHETQLVSPPIFSTFTTEPSTPPYTPPPESVHLTTPSSPEVPFARLLEPNIQNANQRYPFAQYEFQSYQLQPGSPVSHLISPRSGISGSGTSSPFPDREFAARNCPFFLEFRTGNPPKLLDLEKIVQRNWGSRLDCENSDVGLLSDTDSKDIASNGPIMVNRKVSFEMNGDEVVRCVEKKPVSFPKLKLESVGNGEHKGEENGMKIENGADRRENNSTTAIFEKKRAEDDGNNLEQKREKTHMISHG